MRTPWQALQESFGLGSTFGRIPAVCVPPSATLIRRTIPADLQRRWDIEVDQSVLFVQTNADENRYRDALQLPGGQTILLQYLKEGLMLQIQSSGGSGADGEEAGLSELLSLAPAGKPR